MYTMKIILFDFLLICAIVGIFAEWSPSETDTSTDNTSFEKEAKQDILNVLKHKNTYKRLRDIPLEDLVFGGLQPNAPEDAKNNKHTKAESFITNLFNEKDEDLEDPKKNPNKATKIAMNLLTNILGDQAKNFLPILEDIHPTFGVDQQNKHVLPRHINSSKDIISVADLTPNEQIKKLINELQVRYPKVYSLAKNDKKTQTALKNQINNFLNKLASQLEHSSSAIVSNTGADRDLNEFRKISSALFNQKNVAKTSDVKMEPIDKNIKQKSKTYLDHFKKLLDDEVGDFLISAFNETNENVKTKPEFNRHRSKRQTQAGYTQDPETCKKYNDNLNKMWASLSKYLNYTDSVNEIALHNIAVMVEAYLDHKTKSAHNHPIDVSRDEKKKDKISEYLRKIKKMLGSDDATEKVKNIILENFKPEYEEEDPDCKQINEDNLVSSIDISYQNYLDNAKCHGDYDTGLLRGKALLRSGGPPAKTNTKLTSKFHDMHEHVDKSILNEDESSETFSGSKMPIAKRLRQRNRSLRRVQKRSVRRQYNQNSRSTRLRIGSPRKSKNIGRKKSRGRKRTHMRTDESCVKYANRKFLITLRTSIERFMALRDCQHDDTLRTSNHKIHSSEEVKDADDESSPWNIYRTPIMSDTYRKTESGDINTESEDSDTNPKPKDSKINQQLLRTENNDTSLEPLRTENYNTSLEPLRTENNDTSTKLLRTENNDTSPEPLKTEKNDTSPELLRTENRDTENNHSSTKLLRTENNDTSPEPMKTENNDTSPELLRTENRDRENNETSPELLRTGNDDTIPELLRTENKDTSPELLRTGNNDTIPELLRTVIDNTSSVPLKIENNDTSPKLLRTQNNETSPEPLRTENNDTSPELLRTGNDDRIPELLRTENNNTIPELLRTVNYNTSSEPLRTGNDDESPDLLRTENNDTIPELLRTENYDTSSVPLRTENNDTIPELLRTRYDDTRPELLKTKNNDTSPELLRTQIIDTNSEVLPIDERPFSRTPNERNFNDLNLYSDIELGQNEKSQINEYISQVKEFEGQDPSSLRNKPIFVVHSPTYNKPLLLKIKNDGDGITHQREGIIVQHPIHAHTAQTSYDTSYKPQRNQNIDNVYKTFLDSSNVYPKTKLFSTKYVGQENVEPQQKLRQNSNINVYEVIKKTVKEPSNTTTISKIINNNTNPRNDELIRVNYYDSNIGPNSSNAKNINFATIGDILTEVRNTSLQTPQIDPINFALDNEKGYVELSYLVKYPKSIIYRPQYLVKNILQYEDFVKVAGQIYITDEDKQLLKIVRYLPDNTSQTLFETQDVTSPLEIHDVKVEDKRFRSFLVEKISSPDELPNLRQNPTNESDLDVATQSEPIQTNSDNSSAAREGPTYEDISNLDLNVSASANPYIFPLINDYVPEQDDESFDNYSKFNDTSIDPKEFLRTSNNNSSLGERMLFNLTAYNLDDGDDIDERILEILNASLNSAEFISSKDDLDAKENNIPSLKTDDDSIADYLRFKLDNAEENLSAASYAYLKELEAQGVSTSTLTKYMLRSWWQSWKNKLNTKLETIRSTVATLLKGVDNSTDSEVSDVRTQQSESPPGDFQQV